MNKKLLYSAIGVIVLVLIILYAIGSNMPDTAPQQTAQKAQPVASEPPSSPTTASVKSAASKLAFADLGHVPDAATVAKYQSALDSLKPLCTENEATLAGEIWGSWKDLVDNQVTDETNLSLISHITQSIPSDSTPTDCRGVMAAYLVLREPHR
jgi:hypothetical protein